MVFSFPTAWGQQTSPPVDKKTAEPAQKKTDKATAVEYILFTGALTRERPTDKVRVGCYHRVFEFPMKAGTTYTIDMTGAIPGFDPFLRLEDASGKQVAEDDDSGGGQNARIVFEAPRTETYRIIATTCDPGQTGSYTLSARPGRLPLPGIAGPPGMVITPPLTPPAHFGPLTVVMDSPMPQNPNPFHGYVEYRVTVTNVSRDNHRVTVAFPRYHGNYGINLQSLTRTVDLGPSSQVAASLFQPDLPISGNMTMIHIDGRPQEEGLNYGWPQRGQRVQFFGTFNYQPTILVSAHADMNAVQSNSLRAGLPPIARAVSSGGSLTLTGNSQFGQFAQPGWDSCSKSWLGYSGYDGVVITSAELADRGPEVESALRQYVECGGSLTVVGRWKAPKAWDHTRAVDKGLTRFSPGFGQCQIIEEPNVHRWSVDQLRAICGSWQKTAEPWLDLRTPTEANNAFPVVEHLTIPVRGMFLLMLGFSITIGPVNFYVLARKKRRLWMLWTIPLISLVTCLAVLGTMFAAEGWEGHARTEGITILDETSHQAATLGWTAFYTPVVPSDGLHFSPQTELTAQLRTDTFRMSNRPRTIDWTDEQHLASGWLTARVPAHFMVRKSERRLERVAVRKGKDGTLTMVNGLKADIRKIRFMGRGGKVYDAEDVPAGQEAVLKAAAVAAPPAKVDALRDVYRGNWLDDIVKASETPEALLRPGSYVAALEATPFLEEALRRTGPRKGRSVVYGVMKEPIED